jgi:hypothetical protein
MVIHTMNSPNQDITQQYKICAARNCSDPGIYCMEILYLRRNGWFCERCKNNLIADGLLVQYPDTAPESSHR